VTATGGWGSWRREEYAAVRDARWAYDNGPPPPRDYYDDRWRSAPAGVYIVR